MDGLRFRGYIPGLDVLRGIAIVGVLLYHGFDGQVGFRTAHGLERGFLYLTTWGSTGVQLFFVLSGFLITGILLDSRERSNFYTRFYANRIFRILPAYVLLLIVLKSLGVIHWRFVLACMLYIANMAGLVGSHGYEYPALWSLAVEEQFYLIWPWIIRRCSLHALARSIPVYCFLAVLLRDVAERFLPRAVNGYGLFDQADWLLLGGLISITLRSGSLTRDNIRRWMYLCAGVGAATLPVIVYLDSLRRIAPWQRYCLMPLYRAPIGMIFLAMVLLVVSQNRGKEYGRQQGTIARLLSFFGYISYGLYLVHPLIYSFVERWTNHTWLGTYRTNAWALLLRFLLQLTPSVGVAYFSRRYFEQFFLSWKDRRAALKDSRSERRALV